MELGRDKSDTANEVSLNFKPSMRIRAIATRVISLADTAIHDIMIHTRATIILPKEI